MTYKSKYKVQHTKFYQCGRKALFLDEDSAQRRARQINAQGGVKLEAYQCNCDGCRGWHLRKARAARNKSN